MPCICSAIHTHICSPMHSRYYLTHYTACCSHYHLHHCHTSATCTLSSVPALLFLTYLPHLSAILYYTMHILYLPLCLPSFSHLPYIPCHLLCMPLFSPACYLPYTILYHACYRLPALLLYYHTFFHLCTATEVNYHDWACTVAVLQIRYMRRYKQAVATPHALMQALQRAQRALIPA